MSKIGIIALLMVAQSAWADFAPVRAKIEAAMEAEVRTEQDRARDRNRMPIRTLEFFGLRDDMRALELLPGGGWYGY